MSVSSATSAPGTTRTNTSTSDAFSNLGMNEFIKLMITELQNQDPLNPMDNAQMLEQIGQIREIASNDNLTDTLESLMLNQGMSMAGGLMGKTVTALSDDSERIEGTVERILIEDGEAKLIVTADEIEYTVSLNNISEISNSPDTDDSSQTADDSTQTEDESTQTEAE